ncbi:hypothetical protein QQ045_020105 [Rhodiola kirilowii]
MVRLIFVHKVIEVEAGWGSVQVALGLFITVSAIVALCAKRARRKRAVKEEMVPKSPLASPRRIIATISNKASNISFLKKKGERREEEAEGFGEGGLWQNKILMGEKCQPLDFPDAIFYDSYGNRLSEMPKSPRASPMSAFSFPVTRDSMA